MRRPHFFAPRQIRQTNVNLVRSQAYPPAPWVTAQGVEQYQNQSQPTAYMPQAMAFSKYKTPPAGYNRSTLGMSAVNAVQAVNNARARTLQFARVGRQGVPIRPRRVVAEPLNQLPSVYSNLYMNPAPMSRGVLERPDLQSLTQLVNMSRAIASDPIAGAQTHYMDRVGPPRLPDTYRVRRWG